MIRARLNGSMQHGPLFPSHRNARCPRRVGGDPQVADRDEIVAGVYERHVFAQPRHDAFILK